MRRGIRRCDFNQSLQCPDNGTEWRVVKSQTALLLMEIQITRTGLDRLCQHMERSGELLLMLQAIRLQQGGLHSQIGLNGRGEQFLNLPMVCNSPQLP